MSDMLLDNVNINWHVKPSERETFRRMWNEGDSISIITETLGRTDLEVALLVLEQASSGRIKPRKYGIFGGAADD